MAGTLTEMTQSTSALEMNVIVVQPRKEVYTTIRLALHTKRLSNPFQEGTAQNIYASDSSRRGLYVLKP